MNNESILQEITQTLTALEERIAEFNQEQINEIPFAGSWTAGQLAQHMALSNGGFAEMLNGPVADTQRAPDEKAAGIQKDFLDFSTKMNSPAFVCPEETYYNREQLLLKLEKIRTTFQQAVASLDLSKTCLLFELPYYGHLTRLEAATFVLNHTKRHIHQLQHIAQKVL
jgi:hypothetical protein